MDKPRHPQVIRPWKSPQIPRTKWSAPRLKKSAIGKLKLEKRRK